ncbi:hypothetical protein T484DRAFT_2962081 [Baffinella frigidus]|nr:hypothetical protein T484DRAFT_2962081 [Cryptophyta sp. CCMP2293]
MKPGVWGGTRPAPSRPFAPPLIMRRRPSFQPRPIDLFSPLIDLLSALIDLLSALIDLLSALSYLVGVLIDEARCVGGTRPAPSRPFAPPLMMRRRPSFLLRASSAVGFGVQGLGFGVWGLGFRV